MIYKKKETETVEAITFDELIEYGRTHSNNTVNGMPWHFEYKGLVMTHERDDLYIVLTQDGHHYFRPNDLMVTNKDGYTFPCTGEYFNRMYEPVPEELKMRWPYDFCGKVITFMDEPNMKVVFKVYKRRGIKVFSRGTGKWRDEFKHFEPVQEV